MFDDPKISISELINFSSDGIERLRANNPGNVFDQILETSEKKHKAMEDAVNALGINVTQREGRTIDMNDVVVDFKKKVSNVEGLISYTYNRVSGIYQEFYPNGRTEYSHMTIENVEILIKRFTTAIDNHAEDLPPAVKNDFNQLLKDYQQARTEQLKEKGETGGSRDNVNNARIALQLQWTMNVLTIALKFSNQAEKAAIYFNQALLNDIAGQPFTRIKASVDGNTIALIDYDSSLVKNETLLTFRNQSANSTLEFYFAKTQGNEAGTLKIQLDADSEQIISAAEIGFDSDNIILQVKNLDPLAADWEVEIPE
jgi:hypothetical protein